MPLGSIIEQMYQQMMEDLKLCVRPDALRLLTEIGNFTAAEDIPSYLVGGFVRDILLGRDTADIDIAVSADALEMASRVAAALDGKYIPLDELNGVGRVVLPKENREIDFSTLKGDIEQDLSQRDFTIDAMAIKLAKFSPEGSSLPADTLIDPFNGQDDLQRGVIRAVSETAFHADPARLLRAVRLAAELDFSLDQTTETLVRHQHHLIVSVASERVREELLRILTIPRAGQLLAYLDELGLLTALIPELLPGKGVDQPKVHAWDVFDHSIKTVTAVAFLLREGNWEYAREDVLAPVPWSADLIQHFDQEVSHGSTRRSLLKLAALLHDIAKPQTKTVAEDGRARFLGHPQDGAAVAVDILERLRFSNKETRLIELMVKHHLRPTQMSQEGLPSRRAIYRYFRDTSETGIDILFLSLADHLATRGMQLDPTQWQEHVRMVAYVIAKHSEEETVVVPPKLIDGHDLINILELKPGPELRELLEAVREAQASGEVAERQQAIDYVKLLLADPTLSPQKEASQGEE